MKQMIRVALIQQPLAGTGFANLEGLYSSMREAAQEGAELIVLPELHQGPYFCQTEETRHFDDAEPIPGPTTDRLAEMALELGVVVVGSLFERRAPGLYHNTAVVLDRDGRLAGRYRKMHIPDDPGYYEKFYFTPGDLGFRPIDTSLGRLGVLVCWDQWYPEAARLMALAGAELLIYPTAIGWNPLDEPEEKARQRNAWMWVQQGHAVANGLPVLVANRIGHEADPSAALAGIDFWGGSFAVGPQGEFLVSPADLEPTTMIVDIDRSRSEAVRRIWPFLRDRRIDSYGDLLRRYLDDPR